MVRTLDGTYTTFVSNVRSNANARYGAIGVIGHHASGKKGSSTLTQANGAYDHFAAGANGEIYTFDNFAQVINKLGNVGTADNFTIGTSSSGGAGISGYDPKHNLLRSLELIYLANPNARTHVAILTGDGTSAAAANSDDGVTEALAELIKYDDISYIVGAGMDPNTTLRSHAIAASNETNKAERVYVAGASFNQILSGSTYTLDTSEYDALTEENGRVIMSAGNFMYNFQCDPAEAEQEIGGNFYAAYIAGLLSSLPEAESALRKSPGLQQKYADGTLANAKEFRWSIADLNNLVGSGVFVVRNTNGRNQFSRALTFSSSSSDFRRITKRRIVDRVAKEIRATADSFIGRANTSASRLGMQSSLSSKLSSLASIGMIGADSRASVFVQGTDVADGVVRVSVVFRPSTEIEFVEIQQTVEV